MRFERELQASARLAEVGYPLVYLHSQRVPLDEVAFNPMTAKADQFGNECEGMCGN